MINSLHLSTLPTKTAELAQHFQEQPHFLSQFYLSGGTALALQIGHRESEDLDFFSSISFKPEVLQNQLQQFGTMEETELAAGTLNTFISGVKLQFLEYPYSLIEPCVMWEQIQVSSILDIACTKLHTISSRGSKKDFIDLYFLLKIYSLDELFSALEKKYTNISYNKLHILKSLVYFVDAEQQPMPRMHIKVSWDEVKDKIAIAVKNLALV